MFDGFGEFFYDAYIIGYPKKFLATLFLLFFFFCLLKLSPVARLFGALGRVRSSRLLMLILILAAGLRAFWAVQSPTQFPESYEETEIAITESSLVNIYSLQIAGQGIPLTQDGDLSVRRQMGYPYLLGLFHRIFGYHPYTFIVLQVLFGILMVAVAYYLCRTLFRSEPVALLTALLTAVYPQNIFTVPLILDEYPFFFILFAALYWIARNLENRRVDATWRIGLLLGIAAMFRTHALFVPLIMLIAYLANRLPWRKSLLQTGIAFFLIYLINAPWAVVTYLYYGKPMFFAEYGSTAFYGTLNDRATWHNGYIPMTAEDGGNAEFLEVIDQPAKRAAVARKLAVEWVIENPVKTAKLFVMRNLALYGFHLADEIPDLLEAHAQNQDSWGIRFNHAVRKINAWSYGILFTLGLFGLAVLAARPGYHFFRAYPGLLILILLIAYWCAIHGFLWGFRKYRWFFDLLLIYPASYFLYWFYRLVLPKNK